MKGSSPASGATTGQSHALQEFVEVAFAEAGLDWRSHVVQGPALLRPSEIRSSRGDADKARRLLGWQPTLATHDVARTMVRREFEQMAGGIAGRPSGT